MLPAHSVRSQVAYIYWWSSRQNYCTPMTHMHRSKQASRNPNAMVQVLILISTAALWALPAKSSLRSHANTSSYLSYAGRASRSHARSLSRSPTLNTCMQWCSNICCGHKWLAWRHLQVPLKATVRTLGPDHALFSPAAQAYGLQDADTYRDIVVIAGVYTYVA